jgi:stage V sporulation protein SpoVS
MTVPLSVYQGKLTARPAWEVWALSEDSVAQVADGILALLETGTGPIDVASIGPAALNQSVKGIAEARARLRKQGLDLVVVPWFSVIVNQQDEERTRIMLRLWTVPAAESAA